MNQKFLIPLTGIIKKLIKASEQNEEMIVFVQEIYDRAYALRDYRPFTDKQARFLNKLLDILSDQLYDSFEMTSHWAWNRTPGCSWEETQP